MARKSVTGGEPKKPPLLLRPRNAVREDLLARIELGQIIRARSISSQSGLEEARREYGVWNDYNAEMLRRFFSEPEYSEKYVQSFSMVSVPFGEPSLQSKIDRLHTDTDRKLQFLTSLSERLDLVHEAPSALAQPMPAAAQTISRKVFLVHGHDDGTKEIVARFLEKCGLQAIILHEQADCGRTIIEKFEQSSDVGFAVVLLTPDDVGGAKVDGGDLSLVARARQNVILELGYFVGKLGRSKVCALRRGDVEIPSDFSGVVYTTFGPDDAWKMKLAREIKASGISIDLNEALS